MALANSSIDQILHPKTADSTKEEVDDDEMELFLSSNHDNDDRTDDYL